MNKGYSLLCMALFTGFPSLFVEMETVPMAVRVFWLSAIVIASLVGFYWVAIDATPNN